MRRTFPSIKGLFEVIVVFGLAVLLFRIVYNSPLGSWERLAVRRPVLEYVVVMVVLLAGLALARRDFAAYGITLRDLMPLHSMACSQQVITRPHLADQHCWSADAGP